jgi:hypothetical protein
MVIIMPFQVIVSAFCFCFIHLHDPALLQVEVLGIYYCLHEEAAL